MVSCYFFWFDFVLLFNKVIWFKHVHDVASLSSVETFWARSWLRSFQMVDFCLAGVHLHIVTGTFLFFVCVRFCLPFSWESFFLVGPLCLRLHSCAFPAASLSVPVWSALYTFAPPFPEVFSYNTSFLQRMVWNPCDYFILNQMVLNCQICRTWSASYSSNCTNHKQKRVSLMHGVCAWYKVLLKLQHYYDI